MHKTCLFLAAATIAFFVTIESPVNLEAGFHADFEPATQIEVLQVSLPAPKLPVETIRTL